MSSADTPDRFDWSAGATHLNQPCSGIFLSLACDHDPGWQWTPKLESWYETHIRHVKPLLSLETDAWELVWEVAHCSTTSERRWKQPFSIKNDPCVNTEVDRWSTSSRRAGRSDETWYSVSGKSEIPYEKLRDDRLKKVLVTDND